MGKHDAIRTMLKPADLRRLMLELNAAGNRAILHPDGTLVSEPITAPPSDSADLIDWSRPT